MVAGQILRAGGRGGGGRGRSCAFLVTTACVLGRKNRLSSLSYASFGLNAPAAFPSQAFFPLRSPWRPKAPGLVGRGEGRRLFSEEGRDPPSDASEDTIFGKIARGEMKCDKVYEDEKCIAFRDINPVAPTHILVIPKLKISQLSRAEQEVGSKTAQDCLGHLMLVAAQVGREHCPRGCRYVINDGKDGCQSVYHLHVHVIGAKPLSWPPGV
eukprot:763932-Hanusia_phi.AAC.4